MSEGARKVSNMQGARPQSLRQCAAEVNHVRALQLVNVLNLSEEAIYRGDRQSDVRGNNKQEDDSRHIFRLLVAIGENRR